MKLYFFIKVQHTGDTDLGQADKALYDKSYLGSKTTMTSGEWTCLISFATAPLTCSERGGIEKFKMKIYVSSGIRTHTPPVHDRKVAAP